MLLRTRLERVVKRITYEKEHNAVPLKHILKDLTLNHALEVSTALSVWPLGPLAALAVSCCGHTAGSRRFKLGQEIMQQLHPLVSHTSGTSMWAQCAVIGHGHLSSSSVSHSLLTWSKVPPLKSRRRWKLVGSERMGWKCFFFWQEMFHSKYH